MEIKASLPVKYDSFNTHAPSIDVSFDAWDDVVLTLQDTEREITIARNDWDALVRLIEATKGER